MAGAMLSKSLIRISVDGWSCVPSLLSTWGPTMVEVMKIMATSFKRSHACTATLIAPNPAASHHRHTPLLETLQHSLTSKSGSVSCGVTAPFSWVLVYTRFPTGSGNQNCPQKRKARMQNGCLRRPFK